MLSPTTISDVRRIGGTMPTGTMHCPKLESSQRLRRVLRVLCTGRKYSPMSLSSQANAMYNPAVGELRKNGIMVESKHFPNRMKSKAHLYWIPAEHLESARRRLAASRKSA